MLYVPGRGPVTEEESKRLFMLILEDDTEDAPWMVMSSLQWAATSDFYQSLHEHFERTAQPWFVAGMMPILYDWPGVTRKRQLAPDIFVAPGPERPRSSFDSDAEGFPPFILEVVSPSSVGRDEGDKLIAYDMLGAREYALFTPNADDISKLAGYRRDASGRFEPWPRDENGRLWSEILGLYLVPRGAALRLETREGQLLPTFKEAMEARVEAEVEIERLRQENARFKREAGLESDDPAGRSS